VKTSRRFCSARRLRAAVTPVAGLVAALLGAVPAAAAPASGAWAPGRILVMPRAGLAQAELAKILAVHGGKGRKVGQSDLYVVQLAAVGSEKAVARLLSAHPNLKFAEVDQRVKVSFVANDPYAGSEWHLATIGAGAAWDVSQGAGVTIAVLDSGVDGAHPDLAARMVAGWNFYDNNADTSDVYGHGTAVAGTAAASTDNATGVAAVAGQARVMPVRVSDGTGYAYFSTIAQGLTWAADNGARVANISFSVVGSLSVQNAAQYMKNKGGLVVVSAGNNGIDENLTPTTTMIAVSATDTADARASWSSYGNFVAVAAPGANIYTTTRGGGYGGWNGTSFASPVTAGVVALMMAANPGLDGSQVESLLYGTAADRVAPTASITSPTASSSVSGTVTVDVAATDNVGVVRVELKANGSTVAVDTAAPFSFAWDSTGVVNGMASLAAVAYDAAGNATTSAVTSVNVANATPTPVADTTPPVVSLVNPVAGKVTGVVSVTANASDNSGATGISQWIYIDGVLKTSGAGATLAYSWNTKKEAVGTHVVQVTARDKAGNTSTASVQVIR
jgi:thermitase